MEYSFDINSETEKFELYYLKCIFAGRAHKGFYIVYPSKMQKWLSKGLLIWQVYMVESTLPTDNRNFRGQTNKLTFCLLFDIIWLVVANLIVSYL